MEQTVETLTQGWPLGTPPAVPNPGSSAVWGVDGRGVQGGRGGALVLYFTFHLGSGLMRTIRLGLPAVTEGKGDFSEPSLPLSFLLPVWIWASPCHHPEKHDRGTALQRRAGDLRGRPLPQQLGHCRFQFILLHKLTELKRKEQGLRPKSTNFP